MKIVAFVLVFVIEWLTSVHADCDRPSSGCMASHDVYWTGDCDGDGTNDHVCSTTTNDNVWVVLSSNGCGNWKYTSAADCPAAFAVDKNTEGNSNTYNIQFNELLNEFHELKKDVLHLTEDVANLKESKSIRGSYLLGDYNKDCPLEAILTTKDECTLAGTTIGLPFFGISTGSRFPAGCFASTHYVYYNEITDESTTSPKYDYRGVCRATGCVNSRGDTFCEKGKGLGFCTNQHADRMKTDCRKSCGFCD